MNCSDGGVKRLGNVQIVVSCVKSKRLSVAHNCNVSSHGRKDLAPLAESWSRAIKTARERLPAQELYKGVAWSHVQYAAAHSKEFRFYVASAGCGLVPFGGELPGYQASFSDGSDQIASAIIGREAAEQKHQRWWSTLPEYGLGERPELVLGSDPLIVCCGSGYFLAMKPVLQALATRLGPEAFMLISTGAPEMEPVLAECRLPGKGLEVLFGVTQAAINTRLLRWMLEQHRLGLSWPEVREEARLLGERTRPTSRKAIKRTDAEILDWLRCHLQKRPASSATHLLREFREGGLACEQSRFSSLVRKARCSERGD